MKTVLCLLTAILILLMTGCETSNPTARINEKATVFASLTPAQQADVKAGVIEHGYNADMVYMALGKPSKKAVRETPDGPVEMWTYQNFYAPPAFATPGNAMQQFRADKEPGVMVTNPVGGQRPISATRGGPQTNLHLPEPVMDTLYVQFFDGKVFSIKLESENQ
jgi:hypothetical protein